MALPYDRESLWFIAVGWFVVSLVSGFGEGELEQPKAIISKHAVIIEGTLFPCGISVPLNFALSEAYLIFV